MRRIHWNICTLITSAALLVACTDDQLIENPTISTPSETISFDAAVEWPGEDYIDSRSASASMKRIGNHLLQSDEDSEPLPMGVYVQDGIYPTYASEPESRGAVLTKDKLTSFNVWATLNKAENVGGGSIEYFSNVVFSTGTDGVFGSTTAYYWPGEGPTLDFVAVGNMPAKVNDQEIFTASLNTAKTEIESFNYTVPTDASLQNDIVLATSAGVSGNKNASVPLDFKHIMSAVNVKIGTEMTAGTINSITFKNIKSKGTYNVANGSWENINTPTDYTVVFKDDGVADNSGYYTNGENTEAVVINGDAATFMMIPQELVDATDATDDQKIEIVVSFTYDATGNTRNDLKATLNGQTWEMGKTTNYMINISPDFILTIEEESVPIADCHYDMREITISDESNVGWTLTSNVDWVKFRVKPADYDQNTNYAAYEDYWIETHTVEKVDIVMDQTKEDDSTTDEDERITTTTTTVNYSTVSNLSGSGDATVLVYLYENTGSSSENTRETTLVLKDSKGNVRDEIEVKQYFPLWNSEGMAYERIEEDKNTYPWGFASSRTVTYTYPSVNNKPSWATADLLGKIIWGIIEFLNWDEWFYQSQKETRGEVYSEFYATYYETAAEGFITISPSGGDGTSTWGENNAWSVKLDYSKLNNINANSTGLENTIKILTYGGGTTSSDAETFLTNKSLTKGTETNNTDNTTIPQTAAYQAVKKNRWNMKTTITTTTTITESQGTHVDTPKTENELSIASDDIEWFLPSNTEIGSLKSTACDTDGTNNDEALSNTYWTSTSADNVQAYNYGADATSGTAVSRVSTTKHKIRAARIKP